MADATSTHTMETTEYIPYNVYCFLCNKKFATKRNLKIHEERLHQVCKKPTFICNYCNTGFDHYSMFQDHHSARLKRTLSKKTRKRYEPDQQQQQQQEQQQQQQQQEQQILIVKKIKKEMQPTDDGPDSTLEIADDDKENIPL
jgi:transcription initiation factor TFIID subunit TAF12